MLNHMVQNRFPLEVNGQLSTLQVGRQMAPLSQRGRNHVFNLEPQKTNSPAFARNAGCLSRNRRRFLKRKAKRRVELVWNSDSNLRRPVVQELSGIWLSTPDLTDS